MLETAKLIACTAQNQHNWKVYAVGGFVRDMIVGKDSKDLDLEVFGPESFGNLVAFLEQFGRVTINQVRGVDAVAKVRINGISLDVTMPRIERKVDVGYTGFEIELDGQMTTGEASMRRDYTFNTLMYDLINDKIIDHFYGQDDLKNRRLKHTSKFFADDPLRVLRGMQFCGRFDLVAEQETVDLAWFLLSEFETLSKERIWIEFEKWATKSVKPSRGLVFLWRSGWIKKFPEIAAIVGVKQGKLHHPEGSVWQHTKTVCDEVVKIADREKLSKQDRLILVLAALCHDFGKAVISIAKSDEIVNSVGHDIESEKLAQSFLESIDAPKEIVKKVCILVREHMVKPQSEKAVRRLANRLDCVSIEMLSLLIEADCRGRKIKKEPSLKSIKTMLRIAREIEVADSKPKPILMGRHLIALGLKPGPRFGVILRWAFNKQLDSEIQTVDEGIKEIERFFDIQSKREICKRG